MEEKQIPVDGTTYPLETPIFVIAIASRMLSNSPLEKLEAVCQVEELSEMRKTAQTVYVHPDLMKYLVELVQAARNHHMVESGVTKKEGFHILTDILSSIQVPSEDCKGK